MPPRYWIFVALTLALTLFIAYGAYRTAQLLRTWRPESNLLLRPAEIILRAVLIALCISLGSLSGLEPVRLGWVLTDLPRQVVTGMIWGGGMALFFYLTTRWLVTRTGRQFYSDSVLAAIIPRHAGELIPIALAMLLVVTLEELLFRSLLLGGLAPIIAAPALLAITSLGFGLLHSPQGTWGMLGAGLAGFLLGAIFLREDSLIVPLVAHYVTNMFQIIQAMRLQNDETNAS